MTGRASSVQGPRWVQVLLLSLMWATIGSAATLVERLDVGHSFIAAKAAEPVTTRFIGGARG